MIDGGEPRVPQKGEVKRRGEPPIGGRVKRPPRARVRASSGFRQSLPAAGLGRRSNGWSPNAAGLAGFHRRRGLCGESSLKAKETEPCGGSGSSHGTKVEGPAGGAGPSRFRSHRRGLRRLIAPPTPIAAASASPAHAGQLRLSPRVANSTAARTATRAARAAASARGSRVPVSSIATQTSSTVVASRTAMPKPCQPERLAQTRPTAPTRMQTSCQARKRSTKRSAPAERSTSRPAEPKLIRAARRAVSVASLGGRSGRRGRRGRGRRGGRRRRRLGEAQPAADRDRDAEEEPEPCGPVPRLVVRQELDDHEQRHRRGKGRGDEVRGQVPQRVAEVDVERTNRLPDEERDRQQADEDADAVPAGAASADARAAEAGADLLPGEEQVDEEKQASCEEHLPARADCRQVETHVDSLLGSMRYGRASESTSSIGSRLGAG